MMGQVVPYYKQLLTQRFNYFHFKILIWTSNLCFYYTLADFENYVRRRFCYRRNDEWRALRYNSWRKQWRDLLYVTGSRKCHTIKQISWQASLPTQIKVMPPVARNKVISETVVSGSTHEVHFAKLSRVPDIVVFWWNIWNVISKHRFFGGVPGRHETYLTRLEGLERRAVLLEVVRPPKYSRTL